VFWEAVGEGGGGVGNFFLKEAKVAVMPFYGVSWRYGIVLHMTWL
jgi:hypothetical protein